MNGDIWSVADRHPAGYRELDVDSLQYIEGPIRIVDVRQPDEYVGELGHIVGSQLVPLEHLDSAAASWPRGELMIMVCRSGGRSGLAAEHLTRLGFSRVINLRGGMLSYRARYRGGELEAAHRKSA
jgi:rhodanese-related sulfurtransferase